jgi:predicted DNA-binding transcriptional regulator YafY
MLTDFIDAGDKLYKKNNATEFEVIVSEKGRDIYQKENYPSMRLDLENGQYYLRGFFNEGERNFIARYLIGYGKTIISIKPASLSRIIIDKIEQLENHFYSLPVKD